jgi:hypothetical protein
VLPLWVLPPPAPSKQLPFTNLGSGVFNMRLISSYSDCWKLLVRSIQAHPLLPSLRSMPHVGGSAKPLIALFSPPSLIHINCEPRDKLKAETPLPARMTFQQTVLAICGATVVYALYKRCRTSSISDVPGPKNPSWIYGISRSPTQSMTLSHRFWNRTPVVVGIPRGQCR